MSTRRRRLRAAATILATSVLTALAPGAADAGATRSDDATPRVSFPASAVILRSAVTARLDPSATSRAVAVFPQFRKDFRPTVLQVLAERRTASGARWLRVAIPGRPNGRHGWIPSRSVDVRPVTRTIVVDLSARRLRVVEQGRTRFATRVAVGRPGAETPTGLFYLTAVFRPTERYLGAYAFETSAYSKLSEWPGGGIVGLHGTTMPQLLGRAVSHGCVRMSNAAARALKRLVAAGTPLRVVR